MAGSPGNSKWDLTNWVSGKVTFFQALGIKKGTITYPQLTTQLTTPAAEAAQASASSSSSSTSTGSGSTTAPAGSSQTDWVKALLTSLNAPQTPANINSLISWMNRESPWNSSAPDGALYTNNPLNTTQAATGATSINSDGVKKYTTSAEGIAATVATIIQYPAIAAALRSGNGLCGSNLSSSFSKWSGGGYTSVC